MKVVGKFVVFGLFAFLLASLLVACRGGSGDGDPVPGVPAGVTMDGPVRHYFIAAEESEWNYAPNGNVAGQQFEEKSHIYINNVQYDPTHGMAVTDSRIGRTYKKALYKEYTDASFITAKPIPASWSHLGTLGPVIRAEVGDTIQVEFLNRTRFPYSIHPHGVFYDKASEGALYNDGTSGVDKLDDAVPPGGRYTYVWPVPERSGPGPSDGSSIGWMYHSHVDETIDTYSGLIGPMIISRKGATRPDGTPVDVDREIYAMFHIFNENRSYYIDDNIQAQTGVATAADIAALKVDPGFVESNLMHSINGYVYGNLPGLTMKKGERVRWYLMAMGNEADLHTPHWHGNTTLVMGMRTDVVSLLPAAMVTADMQPDNPGTWLFHCHVNDHIDAGMISTYLVLP